MMPRVNETWVEFRVRTNTWESPEQERVVRAALPR